MKTIPVRTLIIDDDASVCRRLHGWLEEARYTVVSFTEPQEGLRHAAQSPCHVALVDLRLPSVNGADVIASLCRLSPQTRVVAMTAFPDTQQVIAAVRAGARDLLEKPIQQPALLTALERQLSEVGIAGRTEEEFNRRLGARLRELRQGAGRTLAEVSTEAGVSAAQVSQIELGRNAASTWTLARICAALRVPMASLFEKL
jgi:DNA-binding NtrC family response regulator